MESLGIKRLESVHYYVHDLERSRRFYTGLMDFAEIGGSGAELTKRGRQKSLAFLAGNCVVVCIEPLGEGGRAWRWLRKHPDGVGTLNFEVEDVEKTFRLLEGRGGTPIDDVRWFKDERGGELGCFSITTPFGDTTFRFVERHGYRALFPGFEEHAAPAGGTNRFGFVGFDHMTSNFPTLGHVSLWLEHVMGFERFWEIQFHTTDVDPGQQHGSGLRSLVFWDPRSGVKFANNEPWRPFFRNSQINIFCEEQRGDGVQHLAISVEDIVSCVRMLRERGVEFMPTPGTYYDALPERLGQARRRHDRRGHRGAARPRDPRRRRRPREVPAADLPEGVLGPLPRRRGGAVLLRDHPAQGRPGLRRRQLPRAVRVHRARAAGSPAG